MKIKAIETRYAGCRFRSRLEARWAVFFDRLGITWEYEPQGHMVGVFEGSKWAESNPGRPYLPDFWLPHLGLWVEVKGSEDNLDHSLILAAVVPHGGLPHHHNDLSRAGDRMLILGPIPRPGGRVAHSLLRFWKGDVERVWAEFTPAGAGVDVHYPRPYSNGDPYGDDSGSPPRANITPPLTACAFLKGEADHMVTTAYTAARFEHGESGA